MKNTFRLALRGLTQPPPLAGDAARHRASASPPSPCSPATRATFRRAATPVDLRRNARPPDVSRPGCARKASRSRALSADRAEVERITALLREERTSRWSRRVWPLSGLMSNSRASTIFIAEAIEPAAMARFQDNILSETKSAAGCSPTNSRRSTRAHRSGRTQRGASSTSFISPSTGRLRCWSTRSPARPTRSTSPSATFNTGNAGSNDKFAYMPLALARFVARRGGRADRLTILLDDMAQTLPMQAHLLKKIPRRRLRMSRSRPGATCPTSTIEVRGMFDMIFGFIFLIVADRGHRGRRQLDGHDRRRTDARDRHPAPSVSNAPASCAYSPTESMLTLLGCTLGLAITIAVRWGINLANVSYRPCSASPVPLLHLARRRARQLHLRTDGRRRNARRLSTGAARRRCGAKKSLTTDHRRPRPCLGRTL